MNLGGTDSYGSLCYGRTDCLHLCLDNIYRQIIMTREAAKLYITDAKEYIKSTIDRASMTESGMHFLVQDLRLQLDRIESFSHYLS